MSVYNAYLSLSGTIDAEVATDERMALRTSYRIGGPAALHVTVHSYQALVRTIQVLDRERVSWVVLGRGSNILVSDQGYDGCVIKLGREFSRISLGDDATVTAGAGAMLAKLVNECQQAGLSGLEACVGIPGTVGGAVSMDAGTRHEWIGHKVRSVVTYVPGKGLRRRESHEVDWGYRATSIPGNEVILEATFGLELGDPGQIAADMEERLVRRREHQPIGKPSCGSVFRNPMSGSVGSLIEACGLKGATCGAAQVSDVHANFVVNNGGATAVEVLTLIRKMHDEVLRQQGIDLVPEVKFLGF